MEQYTSQKTVLKQKNGQKQKGKQLDEQIDGTANKLSWTLLHNVSLKRETQLRFKKTAAIKNIY